MIVDVGGEWCIWCHILDRFVAGNADVKQLVDTHYIWLKVNWSPQNKNEALLSRWPKFKGYPHLFVLDGEGKLVRSQDTGVLEAGQGLRQGQGHRVFEAVRGQVAGGPAVSQPSLLTEFSGPPVLRNHDHA